MTLTKLAEATAAGFTILARQLEAMDKVPGSEERAAGLLALAGTLERANLPAKGKEDCPACQATWAQMEAIGWHPKDRHDECPRCGADL